MHLKGPIFFLVIGVFLLGSQYISPKISNKPFSYFKQGEKLVYKARYGFFDAGVAVLDFEKNVSKVYDEPCFKVSIKAQTTGASAFITTINNSWISYMDTVELKPKKFVRNIQENSYRKDEVSEFNYETLEVAVSTKEEENKYAVENYEIPNNIQDIISSFYRIRSIDFGKLKKNSTFDQNIFIKDKVYPVKIQFLGKEIIETKFGKVKTYIISPVIPSNPLFEGNNPIKAWISNDINHVLIKAEADLIVGEVILNLDDFRGLNGDLNQKK
ncbi:MAG: DUF3108 domain-containing protein [Flammeovirgaceae bacterium]|nr:DUF3108 domain-containing protein [Flammeovirgaceae bacterium]